MRVGIYARGVSERSGGAKVYIYELTKALTEVIGAKDELFIFHNADKSVFSKKKNIHEVILKSKNKLYADFIEAPREINKLNLDVVLFLKNVIPYGIKAKKFLTIHDLAYYMPQYDAYKLFDNLYMKFMIKSSCKRADKIIAVSANTKKDIIDILGIPEKKIEVVHEGVNDDYKVMKKDKGLDKIREKYGLGDKFIFYAGSISPRKNLKRLINAFNDIQDKIDYDLVITGNKLWNNKEEMQMIKENPRIKVLGFIPDEDLPILYNLASLYVYPSLYEGFGLPILEAQASGCPVISSNASSLPEVAGKGALYFDPEKEGEIAKMILKLAGDDKLKDKLVKIGFDNVKGFSWGKSAEGILEVLKI